MLAQLPPELLFEILVVGIESAAVEVAELSVLLRVSTRLRALVLVHRLIDRWWWRRGGSVSLGGVHGVPPRLLDSLESLPAAASGSGESAPLASFFRWFCPLPDAAPTILRATTASPASPLDAIRALVVVVDESAQADEAERHLNALLSAAPALLSLSLSLDGLPHWELAPLLAPTLAPHRCHSHLRSLSLESWRSASSLPSLRSLHSVHLERLPHLTDLEPLRGVHTVSLAECAAVHNLCALSEAHSVSVDTCALVSDLRPLASVHTLHLANLHPVGGCDLRGLDQLYCVAVDNCTWAPLRMPSFAGVHTLQLHLVSLAAEASFSGCFQVSLCRVIGTDLLGCCAFAGLYLLALDSVSVSVSPLRTGMSVPAKHVASLAGVRTIWCTDCVPDDVEYLRRVIDPEVTTLLAYD